MGVSRMKIKVYILTYNNANDLNSGLAYFFNSDAANQTKHIIELNVINNHTNFQLQKEFAPYVKVYHNVLQPDWGTGHNSRNWNQALILGFKNLVTPDADVVITAHDDTWWGKDWLALIENALGMGYTYIACGLGDNIQLWTPEGLRTIGLWDERYCTLAFAEHDYFFRAALLNGPKTSINDKWHSRMADGKQILHYEWNPLSFRDEILQRPPVNVERQNQINYRRPTAYIGRELFIHKWGVPPEQNGIPEMIQAGIRRPKIPNYMYYPYFENAITTLDEQNYVATKPYVL